jgi:hypothetical protein
MLTELSVVEQRYLAVREALDGARITDVATRYGVDRRTTPLASNLAPRTIQSYLETASRSILIASATRIRDEDGSWSRELALCADWR